MRRRRERPRHMAWLSVSALALLIMAPVVAAEPEDAAALAFFEKQVRPVLVEHCQKCHGPQEQKGGLRLDSRAAVLEGGDTGPAVMPGKPDESLLVDAVRYGETYQMPPKGKLPQAVVDALAQWVKLGAPWPKEAAEAPQARQTSNVAAGDFWAFQPPVAVDAPATTRPDWIKSPIDGFILAELEKAGLTPAPAASKAILLRRATFDLTGLPPTVDELRAFLADDSPDAFAKVVDRLLASPRYGEHWARHWLDVARYADSNGMDENLAFAQAWRYRDYVIEAFNRDKPFDDLVREQLAGDLLPAASESDRHENLVATGILVIGPKMLAEDDPVKMEMDIVDEQVDTLGQAFMGLTIGCARCHDHKFDPITMADYYGLAGILKSTRTMENFKVVARWQERPLATEALLAKVNEQRRAIDKAKQGIANLQANANRAVVAEARKHLGQYLLAAAELRKSRELTQGLATKEPDEGRSPLAIVLEAESFARGNVLIDKANYGPEIGVLVNRGELPNFVEHEVDAGAGGAFQIELRYAAAEARPCRLIINGTPHAGEIAGRVTGSWHPDGQRWEVAAIVAFPAGKNVIRLERDGPFPHFDKVSLLPRELPGNFSPAGLSSAEQLAGKRGLNVGMLNELRSRLDDPSRWPIFAAWRMAESTGVFSPFAGAKASSLEELAEQYQRSFNLLAAAERSVATLTASAQLAPFVEVEIEELLRSAGPPEKPESCYPPETLVALQQGNEAVARLEVELPALPQAMAVSEGTPQNLRIHIRGSHWTLGDEAPRRFPAALDRAGSSPLPADQSGRLQLAEWLVSPAHPLTSRVIVNRLWQWHFGEGLVRTPDNFGKLGEAPTNQALLDWLAARFVESGWSIKSLHRVLMLSSAYQMSGRHDESAAQRDPENRLWWRYPRRRMSAEELRDAILAISGRLDPATGGTLLTTKNREYVAGTSSVDGTRYDSRRRAVYLPVIRSAVYDMFGAFDFADPSVLLGKRASTTVAPQALFMLNSEFVREETRAIAEQLLADDASDADRLSALYQRLYSRAPSGGETERLLALLPQAERGWQAAGDPAPRARAWQSVCRVLMSANEFIYIE